MHHDINCSMWNKFLIKPSLLKSSCYLRSGFQRPMCDASKFFLVLGSFGAVEMTAHIKQWLMLSRWLWTFSWIMMFIPSNFYITFGFTNVTWTTRIIPFIDNIWLIIVFISKRKWGSYICSVPRYYNSEAAISEFVKFH